MREKRIKPFRDEKVLTAWNGLMLATFAEAGAILGNVDYLEIAKKNADFILANLQANGYLLRTWKDGKAKLNGYLEDYANLADGLNELFQVSGEARYLQEAKRLADILITEFWDEENGGFFFTASNHEELLMRSKDYFDNATPSGNSVAADVLLKLAKLLGDEKYERLPRLRIAAHDVDMRRLLQLLFDLVGDLLLDFARGGAGPVRAHHHHLERERRILGLAELLVRKDPDHGEHHDQVEDERAVLERPLR